MRFGLAKTVEKLIQENFMAVVVGSYGYIALGKTFQLKG